MEALVLIAVVLAFAIYLSVDRVCDYLDDKDRRRYEADDD